MAILDHEAHRAFFDFCVVEVHHPRCGALACDAVGDLDFQHRAGVLCDAVPDTDTFEQTLRREGKRIGAAVECRILVGFERNGVDHTHAETRAGRSQSKCGAV